MKRFVKPVIAGVMYPLSQLIIGIITVLIIAAVNHDVNAIVSASNSVTMTLLLALLSGIITVLFAWRPLKMYKLPEEIKPAGVSPITSILIVLAAFCGISAISFINSYLGLPNLIENLMLSASVSVLGIVVICIAGPILEEIIFRGAALGYMLRKGVNSKVAIIVSALIFGIIHINPAQIFMATFIGLILGVIYYKTRNIILTSVIHIINNSMACFLTATFPEETTKNDTQLHEMVGVAPAIIIILSGIAICVFALMRLLKTQKAQLADNLIKEESTAENGTN